MAGESNLVVSSQDDGSAIEIRHISVDMREKCQIIPRYVHGATTRLRTGHKREPSTLGSMIPSVQALYSFVGALLIMHQSAATV